MINVLLYLSILFTSAVACGDDVSWVESSQLSETSSLEVQVGVGDSPAPEDTQTITDHPILPVIQATPSQAPELLVRAWLDITQPSNPIRAPPYSS